MRRLSLFIFIFSSVFCSVSLAEIPRNLLSAELFKRDIRLPIENKILQMDQNFIKEDFGRTIKYFSNKEVRCQNDKVIRAGQEIFKIIKQTFITMDRTKEVINYYGCSKTLFFREISTTSKNGSSYELIGANNLKVYRSLKKKTGNVTVTSLYIDNQDFIKITEKSHKNYKEVFYKRFPFFLYMKINGKPFIYNHEFENAGDYRLRIYPKNRIEYYDYSAKPISLGKFQETVQFRGAASFIGAIFLDLPETKYVNSGTNNAKLLGELRNAQTFLISNTNINFVKNLINEYIKEVEDGNIVDNRRGK